MEEYIVKVYHDRTEWFNKEKQYHRLDGPAIEWRDENKEWYFNNKMHRIDGPAVEYSSGYKAWYQNGKRHRTDGPACDWQSGKKEWWIEGVQYTKEEFKNKLNPVVELTVDEISKRLGFTVKVVGGK